MLSPFWLFATPWTVAHKAPLCMGFPRQEYWSGLPLPSSGDLPNPGIEPALLWILYLWATREALDGQPRWGETARRVYLDGHGGVGSWWYLARSTSATIFIPNSCKCCLIANHSWSFVQYIGPMPCWVFQKLHSYLVLEVDLLSQWLSDTWDTHFFPLVYRELSLW